MTQEFELNQLNQLNQLTDLAKLAHTRLTRRSWLVLTGAALAGCGGGGGSSPMAALPGTGGTGSPVFAQGTISGFGSVIINGVRFDDGLASVTVDGVTAVSTDLRLGMVAGIQGSRSAADATQVTASSIEVWSIAQGAVTSADAGEFELAGMTIQTDSNTTFDGLNASSDLRTGSRVAVWGMPAGANSDHWLATRVALLTATTALTTVSSGVIDASHDGLKLNELTLTGSLSAALVTGQWVRVVGSLSLDRHSLAVTDVQQTNPGLAQKSHSDSGTEVEIEGFVTTVVSASRLMLGQTEVDVSNAVYSPPGAVIAVNDRVEVHGTWAGNVLRVTSLEQKDSKVLNAIEITARIDQFTSLSDFVMRGQRCDAQSATYSHGVAADVRQGVKVKVTGTQSGGLLKVATLEFNT